MADISGKTIPLTVFILVAFAAAGMYYLMVNMKSFIDNNPKKLVLYYKEAKRFTPEIKTDFLKKHAGFWVYQSHAMVGGVPLKKVDLLELKDNGIIWQVVEWHVKMPSGMNTAFYQIRTGYMEPYGTLKNDTLNDFYTIHQSFITGRDTCFGGWNFLDLWVIRREGASLVVCKRRYEPYKGAVADFFPHGMIDLVGIGGGSTNRFIKKIGNGSGSVQIELEAPVQGIRHANSDSNYANAMAMPDCLALNSLNDLLKQEIFSEYAALKMHSFNQDSAELYLERYYQPLFIYEQFRLFPRPMPREVKIVFAINSGGMLENVQIIAPRDISKMLHDDLIRELQSWRFPPTDRPIQVTHTFSMP